MPDGSSLQRRRKSWALRGAAIVILIPVLLSTPARSAECNGDECQGPPPAPEEVIPGTAIVEGPPNPPVHYPKVRKRHPKAKHGAKHRNGHQRGRR